MRSASDCAPGDLTLAVVIPFLDEEAHLPRLLASIDAQTRRPDRLVLVDDGSRDGSHALAAAFAATRGDYVILIRTPPRPAQADRLASAAELVAFDHGLRALDRGCDVVAKLDADLDLNPRHFAEVLAQFAREPELGLAGAYLSIELPDGSTRREWHPADHIRGASKFYRRECFEQVWPLPPHLGWDTIDEVKARMLGWRTRSIELSGGDSLHLRPTGMHDGRLRAFWRWGECAYGYGAHPLHVLAGAIARSRSRPYLLSGGAYALGWISGYLRGRPRVAVEVRSFRRREELGRYRLGSRLRALE
jgi:glycosyltransferase involved in cell wall biosynthesis